LYRDTIVRSGPPGNGARARMYFGMSISEAYLVATVNAAAVANITV
jgi:hypothetical protein